MRHKRGRFAARGVRFRSLLYGLGSNQGNTRAGNIFEQDVAFVHRRLHAQRADFLERREHAVFRDGLGRFRAYWA